jgi:hypothetical protein
MINNLNVKAVNIIKLLENRISKTNGGLAALIICKQGKAEKSNLKFVDYRLIKI